MDFENIKQDAVMTAADLARDSKAHFTQAVKLDTQLKELIDDGTGESKDSGGDGEA